MNAAAPVGESLSFAGMAVLARASTAQFLQSHGMMSARTCVEQNGAVATSPDGQGKWPAAFAAGHILTDGWLTGDW